MVKDQAKTFSQQNKKIIKDISEKDLTMFLIRRDSEELTTTEEAQRDYLQKMEDDRKLAMRMFKIRDKRACL